MVPQLVYYLFPAKSTMPRIMFSVAFTFLKPFRILFHLFRFPSLVLVIFLYLTISPPAYTAVYYIDFNVTNDGAVGNKYANTLEAMSRNARLLRLLHTLPWRCLCI